MAIRTECRECGRQIRVRDESAGKRVKCPDCGSPVRIPGGSSGQSRRRKTRPTHDVDDSYEGESEYDFDALAAMADQSRGLGSGELEPCLNCGREIGSRARECPYCGEFVQELKRERREEAKRERIRQEKAEERELRRQMAAADDDDEGGWGWVIFILIFGVGNVVLYMTTGWIIIPRR